MRKIDVRTSADAIGALRDRHFPSRFSTVYLLCIGVLAFRFCGAIILRARQLLKSEILLDLLVVDFAVIDRRVGAWKEPYYTDCATGHDIQMMCLPLSFSSEAVTLNFQISRNILILENLTY